MLVGVDTAKCVLNIVTMVACGWITWKNRKYVNKPILIRMCGFMILGMAVGVWLFEQISLEILLPFYGIMILAIASKKLWMKQEFLLPKWSMGLVLLLAGVIHGMFLSGGALLVVYAVSVMKEKKEFRATIAPVWVVLDGILILSHYQLGYYTTHNVVLIVVSMLPLIASIKLGNWLYNQMSQKVFLKITYVLLLISGIMAIV